MEEPFVQRSILLTDGNRRRYGLERSLSRCSEAFLLNLPWIPPDAIRWRDNELTSAV